jgi:hypothetical protein
MASWQEPPDRLKRARAPVVAPNQTPDREQRKQDQPMTKSSISLTYAKQMTNMERRLRCCARATSCTGVDTSERHFRRRSDTESENDPYAMAGFAIRGIRSLKVERRQ